MNPKVSIVIPVYNGSNYLKEAIDSAIAQTYKNLEIIVINDGSDDDGETEKIAKSYGNKIRYYKKENGGVATALNLGIKKMTGEYFSWLSHDDMYYPEKIKKQVKATGGKSSTIVISDWTIVNTNGRKIQTCAVDDRLAKYPSCFLAFDRETHLNVCAMLIPNKLLKNIGLFDESLPTLQDYKMLNRVILAGVNFKIIHQLLLYSRLNHEELLNDPITKENFDFVRSDIIGALSYEDIIGYFGSKEDSVENYREILSSGFPRTAAFLMEKIIRGSIGVDSHNAAKEVLLEDLSRLPEDKMATSASNLISRIAKPSDKKKIMFCSGHWLTGGIERVMSILFKELKNDYEIFLITPYDERKSYIDIPDFVTSIKIANDLFVKHFDSLILSYALLLDIDVAVGFMNLFEKQQNLYKLCVGTKIKTIASNHEYYFYPYKSPGHYDAVERRLSAFAKCNALVWPLNFNAALCGMYVDNNYVIGNPNSFETVREKNTISGAKVILCVGRFNDYVKRVDRILECFSLVLKKVPDAKLVLVGKYDNDVPIREGDITVNNLIKKLAIPSGSIDFVGEVSNVQDYYSKATVLMLTSNSEGFGMVINEAACFGVPTVCNYIPGIEDIITNEENGFITEQDDIVSMAIRICDILTDDGLQMRLGNNAIKKVEEYDSKHVGDQWRYLFDSLIEVKDEVGLRTRLNNKLGYKIKDQQLFSKVLSRELNEIFYMAINENSQHNNKIITFSKIKRLPGKFRANIKYEGWLKTTKKIAAKSYLISRKILKI